ncbi:hypothetical protein ACIPLC_12145 [Kitasatospora sp. NPDC086801]|uniref:hypothetical protein n=1 Tax=Kitasatospora sp. NPDC086801 TaxID=3364066 RepID=UPI003813E865
MSESRPRRGIIRSLRTIVDDAKEIADELIERAAELECNLRDAIIDLLEGNTEGKPSGDTPRRPAGGGGERDEGAELAGLRAELAALREELAHLSKASPARD